MDDFDTFGSRAEEEVDREFNSFVFWKQDFIDLSHLPPLGGEADEHVFYEHQSSPSSSSKQVKKTVELQDVKTEDQKHGEDQKQGEEEEGSLVIAGEFSSFLFWRTDIRDVGELAALSNEEEEEEDKRVEEGENEATSDSMEQDLKEAHVKLQVEHEELEREHEKLKRHKRDRSLIYQAEISKLQEALIETEKQKQNALDEEEEAEKQNLGEKERKHRRNRSMYYQKQIQMLQSSLTEVEKEKDDAIVRAQEIAENPNLPPELERSGETADGYLEPLSNKYTYAQLRAGPVDGINNRKKELYLSDDEFLANFGMTLEEFQAMKEWKKQKVKRDKGLF